MIRRFVKSKEFESPFALRLLYEALGNSVAEINGVLDAEKRRPVEEKSPDIHIQAPEVRQAVSESELKREVDMDEPEKSCDVNMETLTVEKQDEGSDSSHLSSSSTVRYEYNDQVSESTDFFLTEDTGGKKPETSSNPQPETRGSKLNKEKFFSSDSETTSSDCSKTRIRKRKRKNQKEKESGEKGAKNHSDDEGRDLEKLLRMTEIISYKNAKTSESGSEKSEGGETRKDKMTAGSKVKTEEEVSLLECLSAGEGPGNDSKVESEEQAEKEKHFLTLVNDEIKKSFLLSTSDSGSEEEEDEKKKVQKKTQKKLSEEPEEKKKRKDDLRYYRISDTSSEEDAPEKETKDDSSVSVLSMKSNASDSSGESTAKKTKSKGRNSEDGEISSPPSDSGSDIQQVYCKTLSPTKGRKNIKKILKKESLQVETKQALKLETERKKRLSERQKVFDKLFPKTEDSSKFILDFDPVTKQELVVVHDNLARKLKPHQRQGVKFMWDCCFESLKRQEEDSGSGCILAHCMGLGKTLQVITLTHTVLSHDTGVRTVMIMCPLNTVRNWVHEFKIWLRDCPNPLLPLTLTSCKFSERILRVKRWMRNGGVLVLSYEMFRALIKRKDTATGLIFSRSFLEPGPDLVVCDEGHLLKNESSNLSKFIMQIETLRRIILTGTPLQNNLIEYYCMVQFVKPNILGTRKEFMNRFVNPINNGQFEDSTEWDVRIMKRRSHVLHTMLDGFIQRFSYHVLTPFLPEKQEYVISISLTETQSNIYRFFLDTCSKEGRGVLKDFHWMQRVWTHPLVMLKFSERHKDSDPRNATGWPMERIERQQVCLEKYVREEEYEDFHSSGKLVLLFYILKKCREIGDKILVFSQSLDSLDLIEHFLKKAHRQYSMNKTEEFADSWVLGLDYFRMDGSTKSENRDAYCRTFNNTKDKRSRLFLISTRAGGLGINLVAANRVVVFDASWNPSHDLQCIFRVYRFGQKKPCYIYRFLAEATMEEKIYKRQVTKLSLAHRILDEHQIERHYTMGNLQELYRFEPIPKKDWRLPKVPKDSLFAEILVRNRDIIVGYHEHDSLLENKEEEELTEEERRAAWEEYEIEKLTPNPPQYGSLVNGIPNPSFMEKLNNDALMSVHAYRKGLAKTPQNLVFNDSQNQMCKIVDVRTLKGPPGGAGAGVESKSPLEHGRSYGRRSQEGESINRYRSMIDQILQKTSSWRNPWSKLPGDARNRNGMES